MKANYIPGVAPGALPDGFTHALFARVVLREDWRGHYRRPSFDAMVNRVIVDGRPAFDSVTLPIRRHWDFFEKGFELVRIVDPSAEKVTAWAVAHGARLEAATK